MPGESMIYVCCGAVVKWIGDGVVTSLLNPRELIDGLWQGDSSKLPEICRYRCRYRHRELVLMAVGRDGGAMQGLVLGLLCIGVGLAVFERVVR